MANEMTKDVVDELLPLYKEVRRAPFPYDGSRKLLRAEGARYDGLIPDLDMYFSDIAGYCSWGSRILRWQSEKVEEAKERLKQSFFEKHPEYRPLESLITESSTPDLHTSLTVHEAMRKKLLRILSRLPVKG